MTRICFSGGAKGADLLWGTAARERGFTPVHYSFSGHKTDADPKELVILRQDELGRGNKHIQVASLGLGRKWPPKHDYTRKLIQRNWHQIKQTHAVYAIAELEPGTSRVMGGTGWAVQMYIGMNFVGAPLRLFVYDQIQQGWYQFTGEVNPDERGFQGWTRLENGAPSPQRYQTFTGIGSRELRPSGRDAIQSVWG